MCIYMFLMLFGNFPKAGYVTLYAKTTTMKKNNAETDHKER